MQNSTSENSDLNESNVSEVNNMNEQPTGEAKKFYKLLKNMNEPLYEGFYYLSCLLYPLFSLEMHSYGMTGKAFDSFCELLKDVFPYYSHIFL